MVKALTIGFLVVAGTTAGLADKIEISEFTTMDCQFDGETATGENGGAVAILAGTLFATGTANFANNSAENGGAIHILAGTIINETAINFSENSANGDGGAIWASAGTTISLNNATFENNSAAGNGGAIFGEEDLTLNLTGTTHFSGNADANGYGIYAAGTLNLNVEAGEISDAIFAETGTIFTKSGDEDFSLNSAVSVNDGGIAIAVAGTGILTLGENFAGTLTSLELAADSTIDFRGNAIFSEVEAVAAGTLKFSAGTTIFASDCDFTGAAVYLIGGTISDDFANSGTESKITLDVAAAQGDLTLDINAEADGIVALEDSTLTIAADKNLAISAFGAADEISLTIAGAGTLTAQTDDDGELGRISFVNTSESPSGNANFAVSASVAGQTLSVGANTILTLGGNAVSAEAIALAGTLKIETDDENFTAETLTSTTGTLAAGTLNVAEKVELGSGASLEIAEGATLAGDVSLTYTSANLSGAGTVVGDVTASRGTISIAKIDGNFATASNSYGATVAGTLEVTKNFTISDEHHLTLAAGTNLTIGGDFSNAGTLYILGATTLDVTGTLESAGTLYLYADGEISLAGTQTISFADGAKIVLDVSGMSAGTTFDKIENLDENSLTNVTISTTAGTDISDRFRWNSLTNSYVFLGLNGREIATTIYPDLLREQTLQTLNFADAVLTQFNAQNVRKPLFGKTRNTSKYMRGFLERERQFDRTPDKPAIVPVSEENPGDFAKIAEKALCSAWAQFAGTTSTRERDGAHPEYDLDSAAFILGTSVPAGEFWQLGVAGTYTQQTLETAGTARHKLESDFYQLMAFARYSEKDGADATFAIFGGTASTDSTRGNASADFDFWQIGALMDIGLGFMPDPTSYFRTNFALAFAYAHHENFAESGNENYALESAHLAIGRTTVGVSYAFLPIDALQISIGARAHYDFGPETSAVSGYDFATDSSVRLTGRKFSRFSGQFDLLGDYEFSRNFSIFAGGSYVLRNDADELRATAGVRVKF